MDREAWNERYRSADLVWGAEPNRFVAEAFGDREPAGRALDLACGEGRNTIWLAKRGWQVTGIDHSEVAIERARKLADAEGVEVEWICADVTTWEPAAGAFALVLISYLQVPKPDRQRVLQNAATALAPGGELFMIGHALRNLAEGCGGPKDPAVLWDPEDLATQVRSVGLWVDLCDEVSRPVEAEDGEFEAVDVLMVARRTDRMGCKKVGSGLSDWARTRKPLDAYKATVHRLRVERRRKKSAITLLEQFGTWPLIRAPGYEDAAPMKLL